MERTRFFFNSLSYNLIFSEKFRKFKPRRHHFLSPYPIKLFLIYYSPFKISFNYGYSLMLLQKRRIFIKRLSFVKKRLLMNRRSHKVKGKSFLWSIKNSFKKDPFSYRRVYFFFNKFKSKFSKLKSKSIFLLKKKKSIFSLPIKKYFGNTCNNYFSNYSFRKNSNFFKKNLKNSFKNFSFFFRKIINKIFISVRLFSLELSYLRYFYVIRRKKNKKYLFFLSKLDTFLKKLKFLNIFFNRISLSFPNNYKFATFIIKTKQDIKFLKLGRLFYYSLGKIKLTELTFINYLFFYKLNSLRFLQLTTEKSKKNGSKHSEKEKKIKLPIIHRNNIVKKTFRSVYFHRNFLLYDSFVFHTVFNFFKYFFITFGLTIFKNFSLINF